MTTTLKFPQSLHLPMKTESLTSAGEKLRVCHLSMTLRTGGLERLLVDFARFHDSSKYDLRFVAMAALGPPAEELRSAGYDVTSVGMPRVSKRKAIKNLYSMLKSEKIDVLHTHNTYPHFYGSIAARWAGVRTIINTQHGRGCGAGWKSLWQFRIANCLAARVVGVSSDATKLCQEQDTSNSRKMQCIWNGIDVDRFSFSGPEDAPVAISVARLSAEKDFPTLLRAIRKVVYLHPNFRLKLVGDGAERSKLEQLARELKIDQHVEFLGERKDVPELLRTAGFYVSSSKTEGISLTLLEAMAVGLPIVTTAVGGNPEIVVEGETGSLVSPKNPDALATAIIEMLEARALWPTMAEAARTRVEENFSVRSMVGNYEKLYEECYSRV